jgi:hypothetical protein
MEEISRRFSPATFAVMASTSAGIEQIKRAAERAVAEQHGIEPASVDRGILREVVLIEFGLRGSSVRTG